MKEEIIALKDKITELKKTSGLFDLETELKALELAKEKAIADAMVAGIMKEGPLRVVASGRRVRELNQIDFKEAYPDVFNTYAKVTITAAIDAIMSQNDQMPNKEAKQFANDEIERYSTVKEPTSWDVVSLV